MYIMLIFIRGRDTICAYAFLKKMKIQQLGEEKDERWLSLVMYFDLFYFFKYF